MAGAGLTPVWAMQDCGALEGHFGGGAGTGAFTAAAYSSGTDGVQHTPSISKTNSSSHCGSSGSGCSPSAALSSDPILSIDSCTHKAKALSAVCQLVAASNAAGLSGSSRCSLIRTLLATAATAISLQGAAAMPLVCAAVSASSAFVSDQLTGQQPAPSHPPATSVQQQPHGIATPASHLPHGTSQPAASTAAKGRLGDKMLMCLSLAADLTKAVVLQVEVDPALQLGLDSHCGFECVELLQLLLECIGAQAGMTDTAAQLRQLQGVSYTLQLVEAAFRQEAAWMDPNLEVSEGKELPTLLWQYRSCYSAGFGMAGMALILIRNASHAVLWSLQGELLLQSCTSLLLTCNSMVLSMCDATFLATLSLCVQQLQLAAAQAAGGGTSCHVSQSLASDLTLVGRQRLPSGTGDCTQPRWQQQQRQQ